MSGEEAQVKAESRHLLKLFFFGAFLIVGAYVTGKAVAKAVPNLEKKRS